MPLCIHLGFLLLDLFIVDVVVVGHQLVDGTLRCQFDDAVGNGIDELMVVRGEDDVALELYQVVVEGLDTLKVNILFASHDHEFINTVADRIIELTPKGTIDKLMTYDDYIYDEQIKAKKEELYS